MAQVVSCQPLTTEAWVCTKVSPCGICGGHPLDINNNNNILYSQYNKPWFVIRMMECI
jgi:hypothetical protein